MNLRIFITKQEQKKKGTPELILLFSFICSILVVAFYGIINDFKVLNI